MLQCWTPVYLQGSAGFPLSIALPLLGFHRDAEFLTTVYHTNRAIKVFHEGIFIHTIVIILEAVLTYSFWWNQKKAEKPTQKYLHAGNNFHLLTFIYVTCKIIQLITMVIIIWLINYCSLMGICRKFSPWCSDVNLFFPECYLTALFEIC